MTKKRVVIIDGLNTYLRNYIVNPSLSTNGDPIGGLKGFLSSLQKLTRELKPDQVVVVWDGPGGSQRRKAVNKNYKEGRKPIRLNRSVKLLSEEENTKNKIWQQTRLFEYLNSMPVSQIIIEGIEADDIIAQVCNEMHTKDIEKVIVSSDKDFIQRCDHSTVLYRPIQKKVLNKKTVIKEYGISPNWFALARAIVGDKSDNLVGVSGIGLKTIARRFPFFSEGDMASCFYKLFGHCEENKEGVKAYRDILQNKKLIEENYKLMQLYAPYISPQNKRKIRAAIFDMEPQFNRTGIIKMMNEDGFGVYDWTELFANFRKIIVDSKQH
jgi:5'-3' exonuclease